MPGQFRGEIRMGAGGSPAPRQFETVDDGRPPGEAAMRQLRRCLAAAVTVVTVADELGFHGITVSAFTVVSLVPPRVLVCLGSTSDALATIERVGRFAVSALGDTQEFLAERFARRAPLVNRRFDGVPHRLTASGQPVLEDCLAWWDCVVDGRVDSGDHVVLLGDVRAAGFGQGGEPLLYFDGAYRFLQL